MFFKQKEIWQEKDAKWLLPRSAEQLDGSREIAVCCEPKFALSPQACSQADIFKNFKWSLT